jgi:hypothetical protein
VEGFGVWVAASGIFGGPLEHLERAHEWASMQEGRVDPNKGRDHLMGAVYDMAVEFVYAHRDLDPEGQAPPVVVFADRAIPMSTMGEVMRSIVLTEITSLVLMVGTEDGAQGIPAVLEHFDVPAFAGPLPTSYAVDFELVPVGDEWTLFARGRPESAPVATALWGGPARRLSGRGGTCLLARQDAMALLARALEATCDTPSSVRLPVPEESTWGDFVGALSPADRCRAQLRLRTALHPAQRFYDEYRPLPAPTDQDCSNAVSPDELLTALARDGETLAKTPEEQRWREIRAFDENHPSFAAYRSASIEIRPELREEEAGHVLSRLVFLQTDDLIACAEQHREAKSDPHLSVVLSVDGAGTASLASDSGTVFETCLESRLPSWWFPEVPGAPHEVLFLAYTP